MPWTLRRTCPAWPTRKPTSATRPRRSSWPGSAVKGADGATATPLALLLERLAWAQARTGNGDGDERALDLVDDAFARRDPAADPIWVYWLNRDEIDVMAGRVWTQLHRPLRAVPLLEHAIEAYPADAAREVLLYRTWLAEALLQGGEVSAPRPSWAGPGR
jgi:hypothetical protein